MSVPPDQNPMAQSMMAAAPTQAPPAQAPPNPVQAAQDASQQVPTPQDQAQGSTSDPRPVGARQDPTKATPQEQAEYMQLITRYMLMISDSRKPHAHLPSPAAAALHGMNNPAWTVPQAVGYTTADLIFMLHNAAKQQKVQYSPDVLFHAADECIALTYVLGQAAGIFKGTPPYQKFSFNKPYPFTKEEVGILARAKLFAVQRFGQRMQDTGQIQPRVRTEAMAFWKQQIQKEISEGKVDDSMVQQVMSNPKFRAAMQGGQ